MCFSKHFNKYEQIDMFEAAGKVVKTVPSSDPKKPTRLRIFKKDFDVGTLALKIKTMGPSDLVSPAAMFHLEGNKINKIPFLRTF